MQRYDHEKLVAIIQRAGYPVNSEGVCFGVALMGLQAMLAGELAEFNARLDKIFSLTNQQIERLYLFFASRSEEGNLYNAEADLTADEWEIITLCQNIALHLKPYEHPDYFPGTTHQDAITTVNLLAPNKLRETSYINKDTGQHITQDEPAFSDLLEQGKLRKIYGASTIKFYDSITGAFDFASLTQYFSMIQKELFGKQSILPLALLLGCSNHAIAVTFDPSQKLWMIANANKLPAYAVAEHDISAAVIHALSGSQTGCVIMQTQFAGIKSPHETLTSNSINKIKEWNAKNLDINTDKLSAMRDDDNCSYFLLAAKTGDLDAVKKLHQADINAAGASGYTPLMLASMFGHLDVVMELLQRGADTKALDKYGRDAFKLASLNGNSTIAFHIANPSVFPSKTGKFAVKQTGAPTSPLDIPIHTRKK